MRYIDLTAVHLKAARALLGWSQHTLADKSGVAASTIKRLESVSGALDKADNSTRIALYNGLALAGIQFLNGGEPGVRLMSEPQDPAS